MFRSVLDPQLEFGPADLPQVRRHMITRGFQTMRIHSTGYEKSMGTLAFALRPCT